MLTSALRALRDFVAQLITEVRDLDPHWYCEGCGELDVRCRARRPHDDLCLNCEARASRVVTRRSRQGAV